MKKQNVFLSLRVPIQHIDHAYTRIRDVMISNPGVNARVIALSDDGERAELTVVISIPRSNSHPVAIASLNFIHKINLGLFDYSPCYRGAPSMEEKQAYKEYSTQWIHKQLKKDDENIAKANKINAMVDALESEQHATASNEKRKVRA